MTAPQYPPPEGPYQPPAQAHIPGGFEPTQQLYQPPQPVARKKGNVITSKPVIGLVSLVVGLALGAGVGGAGKGTPAALTAQPQVTVTETATYEAEPTESATADGSGIFTPSKGDFALGVKILSKQCFGSAGCNVTFRIKPSYVGTQDLPGTGTIEVSYRVKGGEDPVENTFTIDGDGTAHFESQESASTTSSSKKLTAVVTDVEWNEE